VVIPTFTVPATYTLQKDEFIYCVARRFNLNPNELMAINGLSSNFVSPGRVLTIPQTGNPFPAARALRSHPTTYTVVYGDTIYKIACLFGDVDPMAIAAANGLAAPYALATGQTLNIP
jgi:LysM repeat protein